MQALLMALWEAPRVCAPETKLHVLWYLRLFLLSVFFQN